MPTYEAVCLNCKKVHDYIKPIDQRNETPMCCDVATVRVIRTPPGVSVDEPAAGKT